MARSNPSIAALTLVTYNSGLRVKFFLQQCPIKKQYSVLGRAKLVDCLFYDLVMTIEFVMYHTTIS